MKYISRHVDPKEQMHSDLILNELFKCHSVTEGLDVNEQPVFQPGQGF